MEPLVELTVRRPWRWGVAVVGAVGAALPETLSEGLLTASESVVVVKVRHAEDDDGTARSVVVGVRGLATADETYPAVGDGVLLLPGGRLSVGDAERAVVLDGLPEVARVRVLAVGSADHGADEVRVDVSPAR